MNPQEHIQTASEFLVKSEEEFDNSDYLQASEKLWGAAVHAVLAIAQQRGWNYGSHRDLMQAAMRISEEQGDTSIYEQFDVARKLHANFYQGFLEDHELGKLRPDVHDFTHRVLALVA